ncbi:MAG TPA: hypothetical protein VEH48_00635 [Candidatus Nitrosopolaris sp.]|nr:hypothetical protein [Candidatus Nitrosopolaris sp.]
MPRLVLVVAELPQTPACIVALVTNELEYATHRDVRIEESESGLRYPILVETDITLPAWDKQLDEPIGKLVEGFDWLLRWLPDICEAESHRIGLTLQGPWDSRWAWKERELNQAQRLSAACYRELAGI